MSRLDFEPVIFVPDSWHRLTLIRASCCVLFGVLFMYSFESLFWSSLFVYFVHDLILR